VTTFTYTAANDTSVTVQTIGLNLVESVNGLTSTGWAFILSSIAFLLGNVGNVSV
jgi:hypothetical protein